jgi:hypothetical protein
MSTKLHFLTQIVSVLKYLRDQSVVLNYLNPNQIKIKKSIIKISNFTQAYHY